MSIPPSKRVLLVEDDAHIADLLSMHLRDEGLQVVHCARGDEGMAQLERGGDWDALVLDLMLPGVDGLEICRRARAMARYVPIIIISARASEVHRILGLEIGADDYLPKPFAFSELTARVRALGRRTSVPLPPVLERAGIKLDPNRREVFRDGKEVQLAPKEFAVLEVLMRSEGAVVSAEQLLEKAWDENTDPFTNVVRVTVMTLRRKLGEPAVIVTVPGSGYRI